MLQDTKRTPDRTCPRAATSGGRSHAVRMLDLCASVFMVRRMMTPRLQAAQAGESRYHGRPCKTCGTTLRYVLNCTCVECHRARAVGRSREQRRRMAEMLRAGKEARKLRQRKPKAGGQ